ncbi:MAG: hypothetical protein ACRDI2_24080, partial [Chloroflexota bacterium]
DSFLNSQLQTLRGSLGATRPRPTGAQSPGTAAVPPGAAGQTTASLVEPPAPSPTGASPAPEAPPPESEPHEPRPEPEAASPWAAMAKRSAGETATNGTSRTSVVISGLPHFSRARALWQAIQQLPGVLEAKTIDYQGGVLALEVQHEPAVDLPAHVTDLTGLRLRVTDSAPGQLHLAAEG